MNNLKLFGTKIVENLNALLCMLVGFITFFLLGCPAVIDKSSFGLTSFFDSFGLFAFSKYCVATNRQLAITIFKAPGALSASGVFNVFVLIFAVLIFFIGVFTLLKKSQVFDWKLDEKIGNFDLITKLVFSTFTGFAMLSFLCVAIFAGLNSRLVAGNNLNFNVGGGLVTIFMFSAIACATMWLLPIIMKNAKAKKSKKANADSAAAEKEDAPETNAKTAENENNEDIVLMAEVVEEPVKKSSAATVKIVKAESATAPKATTPKTAPKAAATKSNTEKSKAVNSEAKAQPSKSAAAKADTEKSETVKKDAKPQTSKSAAVKEDTKVEYDL